VSSSFDGPPQPEQPAQPEGAPPAAPAPPDQPAASQAPPPDATSQAVAPPPVAPPPVSRPADLPPPGPPPGSVYPVKVDVPRDPGQNRLWGIPFIGVAIRGILLIPVMFVLFFLALIVSILLLVSWIPILFTGRQAPFIYQLVGTTIRLSIRAALYALLTTGRYPWFNPDHPVTLTFDEYEQQNRLWGIPILGILVRVILLIPHFFVLWVLGAIVGLLVLIMWAPVLVNGRQADSIVDFVGGVYRWGARVSAYSLLLTGKYPPFRLND
jgi:hypothetical protein